MLSFCEVEKFVAVRLIPGTLKKKRQNKFNHRKEPDKLFPIHNVVGLGLYAGD